jgi:hypothetical protein
LVVVEVESVDDVVELEVEVVGGGTVPLNMQEHPLEILEGRVEQALLTSLGVGTGRPAM